MTVMHELGTIPEFTRGDRFRRARLNAGHRNVEDFADLLGVGRALISSVESERHDPRRIVVRAWAMATGVPEHWLETGHAPSPDGDGACSECAIRDSNPEPADNSDAQVIELWDAA